jgi:hypothetical protein
MGVEVRAAAGQRASVVAAMLLSGYMSFTQVHKCLKWDYHLTVAAAIGISNALRVRWHCLSLQNALGLSAPPFWMYVCEIQCFVLTGRLQLTNN